MATIRIQDFFNERGQRQSFEFIFKKQIASELEDQSGRTFGEVPLIVPIDATITENYSLSAQITDNEVQSGGTITDHIHLQPRKVSIKGIISETPVLFLPAAVQAAVDLGTNAVFDTLSGATGFRNFAGRVAPVLGGFEKYARNFVSGAVSAGILGQTDRKGAQSHFWRNFLLARYLDKEAFQIKSGLDVLNNVFFENVTFNRTQDIGDSLVFECTLKEIRFIKSQVVIGRKAGGENHKPVNRGDVSVNEFVRGSLAAQNTEGGPVEQTYPKVPVGSVDRIEDRIRTNSKEAFNKVSGALERGRSAISSFVDNIIPFN